MQRIADQHEGAIEEASRRYGIPEVDILAVITHESRGVASANAGARQRDRGRNAASGLMQVTHETWKHTQTRHAELARYPFHTHRYTPRVNILVGTAALADKREALERLQLNDAALSFEPETSAALGLGFRCGFLGLLHMEVVQERLEREYSLDLVTTAPSVVYRLKMADGAVRMIDNPTNYPDPSQIAEADEPYADAHVYTPKDYVGSIMELCQERRGAFLDMNYLDTDRVDLHYELPLNEIIYDFFDALKSRTRGYASFDYTLSGYRKSNLVKLDILLNGEPVDALSFILFADEAYPRARRMVEKLRDKIPRQLFEVPIQACVGGRVIARETVKALRKDVLSKCYGGDISRKKKLLEKQKEGKKRMRQLGTVEVPKEAFMSILKLDE